MADKELINKFLEQLESLGLEINREIGDITTKEKELVYVENLNKIISQSISNFSKYYISLQKNEKKKFKDILLTIFKDKELVDSIIRELLNCNANTPSKYQDILTKSIKKYYQKLKTNGYEIERKRLEDRLDRIVFLGGSFEDESNLTMIVDIDLLEELLDIVNLTEEEKVTILLHAINQNNKVYERNIKNKHEGKIIEIELQKDENELYEETSISKNKLNRLNELLEDENIIEKIVLIVNKRIKSLSITDKIKEQSVNEARKIIINRLKYNQDLTPEKALEDFINSYELSTNNKTEILREILSKSELSDLNEKKQEEQILKALVYYEENKNSLKKFKEENKQLVNEYIQSIFTNIKNRELVYKNESMTSKDSVIKMATYEIEILKELMKDMDENEKDYSELKSKLSKRFEDILRCALQYQNKIEIKNEKKLDGTIYFLMKNSSESLFEDDLNNQVISKEYYSEIAKLLSLIEQRHKKTHRPVKPINTSLKEMRKQGVLYINGTNINIFYIPIGKKDSIITGIGFINNKKYINIQEIRAKKEENNINEIKEKIKQSDEDEILKQNYVRDRIKRIIM